MLESQSAASTKYWCCRMLQRSLASVENIHVLIILDERVTCIAPTSRFVKSAQSGSPTTFQHPPIIYQRKLPFFTETDTRTKSTLRCLSGTSFLSQPVLLFTLLLLKGGRLWKLIRNLPWRPNLRILTTLKRLLVAKENMKSTALTPSILPNQNVPPRPLIPGRVSSSSFLYKLFVFPSLFPMSSSCSLTLCHRPKVFYGWDNIVWDGRSDQLTAPHGEALYKHCSVQSPVRLSYPPCASEKSREALSSSKMFGWKLV